MGLSRLTLGSDLPSNIVTGVPDDKACGGDMEDTLCNMTSLFAFLRTVVLVLAYSGPCGEDVVVREGCAATCEPGIPHLLWLLRHTKQAFS